jgi:hypothetical protein
MKLPLITQGPLGPRSNAVRAQDVALTAIRRRSGFNSMTFDPRTLRVKALNTHTLH